MVLSRLRDKFLKIKTQSNATVYKKQRNYCLSLFRKEKKVSSKIQTLKTSLIIKNRNKITLTQNDEIISRSKNVAEIFDTFFVIMLLATKVLLSMKSSC